MGGVRVPGPPPPRDFVIPMYSAEVRIRLKKGVADPEGANIEKTLRLLGFESVRGVHATKTLVIEVDAATDEDAREDVERMCARLLANPVIHECAIDVKPAADGDGGN